MPAYLMLICCAVLSPGAARSLLAQNQPHRCPHSPFLLPKPLRNVMFTSNENQPQTGLRFCFVSAPHKGALMSINPTHNHSLGYPLTCRYLLLRMPGGLSSFNDYVRV